MSATRLLVLAVVRSHVSAHGYLVGQELLAWDADQWANTKTGSIYHALRQLTKEGLLIETEVSASDVGTARTDYRLSEAGESAFQKLLEQALTIPEPRPDMLCAGLMLMSALERPVVLGYLRTRLDRIASQKATVSAASSQARWTGQDALPPHVDALLGFWVHISECAHDWVSALIVKIEGGAYVFADDDPMAFGSPGSRFSNPMQI